MSDSETWTVLLHRQAEKALQRIARSDKVLFRRLDRALLQLQDDPIPPGAKRLKGHAFYSLRVGDWRIVYALDTEERLVIVLHIGHRREVYRDI